MITLRNTLEVRRPVSAVYDFVVNLENVPKWQPAVIQTKRVTEGPIREGTQFREVAKIMGRSVESICEITRLEAGKTLAFRGTSNGPFTYATTYTFESLGESTRIAIVGEFRFMGFWRLFEPFAGVMLKLESGKELAAMKAAIEAAK